MDTLDIEDYYIAEQKNKTFSPHRFVSVVNYELTTCSGAYFCT